MLKLLRFLCNHFIKRVVHDDRGEPATAAAFSSWVWPALAGGAGGAILGGLFGGGGEEERWLPYGSFNPEQIALTQQLGPMLQSLLGNAPSYQGQLSTDMRPEFMDIISQSGRLNALAQPGYERLLSGEFPEEEFQAGFATPTRKSFAEDIQPLIEEQYAGSGGYWGSARAGAVLDEYRKQVSDPIAEQRGKLGIEAMQWPGRYGGLIQQAQATAASIQDMPRVIQQYGLDRQYNEWVRTQQANIQYINAALSFLGLSSVAYMPREPSLFEQMLPGMAQGATTAITAAAMSSDVRLKKNIRWLGRTLSGLNIYKWEWRDWAEKLVGTSPTIGMLAQEVMKIIPDAVSIGTNGYLQVNYSKVSNFNEISRSNIIKE